MGSPSPPTARGAYVTGLSNVLAVWNTETRTFIRAIRVPNPPHAVEVQPNGSKIYVADSVNSVHVVDAATHAVVASIPIGQAPASLAVHPDGTRVYVGTAAYVAMIDTATDTVVDTGVLDNPGAVAVSRAGDRVYASTSSDRVTTLDPATLEVVEPSVVVGLGPSAIATGPPAGPVIDGSTWFSSGAKSRSGAAGSSVALYAVGASPGVPYRLVLSRTPACADLVAYLNPTTVIAGPHGLIGTVRGTIPAGTPAGTYWICFRHTAGATATGVVSFTVTP